MEITTKQLQEVKHLEEFETIMGFNADAFDDKDWLKYDRFCLSKETQSKHAVCSDLTIENLFDTNTNHLNVLVELQANTQKNVYGYDYPNMNLREMMELSHMNTHALIDELHEFTDSLGGIKDGSGSAIWKRWKKDYTKYASMKFADLSESDQLEAKFEFIDILHFVFTIANMMNMDGKEIFNMYMSKNKENIDRQNRGY